MIIMKKLLPLIILTLMITGCSKPEKHPETVPSDILIQEDDMTDEEKTRAELDARISFLEMMGGWDE